MYLSTCFCIIAQHLPALSHPKRVQFTRFTNISLVSLTFCGPCDLKYFFFIQYTPPRSTQTRLCLTYIARLTRNRHVSVCFGNRFIVFSPLAQGALRRTIFFFPSWGALKHNILLFIYYLFILNFITCNFFLLIRLKVPR